MSTTSNPNVFVDDDVHWTHGTQTPVATAWLSWFWNWSKGVTDAAHEFAASWINSANPAYEVVSAGTELKYD